MDYKELVDLTAAEKGVLCRGLAKHLPKLRKLMNLSQREFGRRVGVSVDRVSLIENGHFQMTWSQFTSFLFVFSLNPRTKEYFAKNNLFDKRLLQFYQAKTSGEAPEMTILLNESLNSLIGTLKMGDVIKMLRDQEKKEF